MADETITDKHQKRLDEMVDILHEFIMFTKGMFWFSMVVVIIDVIIRTTTKS